MYYITTVHLWRANVNTYRRALMHPAQIKAALTIAGYKQTDAAVACGVAPTTIGAVINGRSRSKQVEDWLSQVTGIALENLWPQWYGKTEQPLSDEERLLVQAYRSMPARSRTRLLAELSADYELPASTEVKADRGSIAAGGDVKIGSATRKGRGK